MRLGNFNSPIALFVVFLMILVVWCSLFLHAGVQSPHSHIVERVMFSAYFTFLSMAAIAMGIGLLMLVFSCVLRAVYKLLGVENKKSRQIVGYATDDSRH